MSTPRATEFVSFTSGHISASFPSTEVRAGHALFKAGHVELLTKDARQAVHSALIVVGRQRFKVLCTIRRDRNRLELRGTCTCPRRGHCAHIVALLFEVLRKRGEGTELPRIDEKAEEENKATHSSLLDTKRGADEVRAWLREFTGGKRKSQETPPLNRLLFYVLEPAHVEPGESERTSDRSAMEQGNGPHAALLRLRVRVGVAQRLKSGRFGHETPFSLSSLLGYVPGYVTMEDRAILGQLMAFDPGPRGAGSPYRPLELSGPLGAEALARILASGRAYYKSITGDPLRLGPALPARIEWLLDPDGEQRPGVVFEADASPHGPPREIIDLEPPWYFEMSSGILGPIDLTLDFQTISLLLRAPPVPPAMAAVVRESLSTSTSAEIPLPKKIVTAQDMDFKPVPRLRLFQADITIRQDNGHYATLLKEKTAAARLSFAYGALDVPWASPGSVVSRLEGETLIHSVRDARMEQSCRRVLQEHGLTPFGRMDAFVSPETHRHDFTAASGDASTTFVHFVHDVVPMLEAQGWDVIIEPSFPYRLVRTSEPIFAELSEQPRHDWFGLEIGIELEGERVNLLPILLEMLASSGRGFDLDDLDRCPPEQLHYLPMPDGRLLPIPAARLRTILGSLLELYEGDNVDAHGRLHVRGAQAAQLAGLEGEDRDVLRWSGKRALIDLGRRLRGFERLEPVEPPRGLKAKLRPYQREGLTWLNFLGEAGIGGCLADDMGLGKTIQALAWLLLEKESGRLRNPALVVSPTSVLVTWKRESRRFAPSLRTLCLHGPNRSAFFDEISKVDVVLTTYPLLWRDQEALKQVEYHAIILDEAQNIKNPRSKAAQVARRLVSSRRICMTGTPLENNLGELWSLFHFMLPGLLGEEKRFKKVFRTPIEKKQDSTRRRALAARVRPFMLRRTKESVVAELPPKTEILREVELEAAQRDLYETIRLAMHKRVRTEISSRGLERSTVVILEALLRLRQVCCDPRLLRLNRAGTVNKSAKLELLFELLPELLAEGRRVLLFSQFVEMLKIIGKRLDALKLPHVELTGQTKDRDKVVDAFQSGEVPLFLISLKAGGTGLNLTAADTVIHYDPWWNPAVEAQATDRAHRIGQDKPVFVYKLIVSGSVEEKILALQARKKNLADSLFTEGNAGRTGFSAEDLELLFQPI